MSNQYKEAAQVPTPIFYARLKELASSASKGEWNDFYMRIPAEVDHDADLVLMGAAIRLSELQMRVESQQAEIERLNGVIALKDLPTGCRYRNRQMNKRQSEINGRCTCVTRKGVICCRLKSWQVPQPIKWQDIAKDAIEYLTPICRIDKDKPNEKS